MNNISTEIIWDILLSLRPRLIESKADIDLVLIRLDEEPFEILINPKSIPSKWNQAIVISKKINHEINKNHEWFTFDDDYNFSSSSNGLLDKNHIDFILRYLCLCFAAQKAHLLKRSFSILHLAQSLDGRIATSVGNSKWIGNQEDLIHAHRMRAMCDAVLIGTHTLQSDSPALTVRHVPGPNPVKVVVGNSDCKFDSLLETKGKVLYFTSRDDEHIDQIENIHLNGYTEKIAPSTILAELYKRKLYSIYIEGGAITASSFLTDQCIDLLQLFIAPKIFGSGINCFKLPYISSVDQAISFTDSSFIPMGDGVLFEGKISYSNPRLNGI